MNEDGDYTCFVICYVTLNFISEDGGNHDS